MALDPGPGADSPLHASEGNWPSQHLDFDLGRLDTKKPIEPSELLIYRTMR